MTVLQFHGRFQQQKDPFLRNSFRNLISTQFPNTLISTIITLIVLPKGNSLIPNKSNNNKTKVFNRPQNIHFNETLNETRKKSIQWTHDFKFISATTTKFLVKQDKYYNGPRVAKFIAAIRK